MIRYAKRDDITRCVELMKESHEAANFAFPFFENYARSLFAYHIKENAATIIVLELSGIVEGILMCTASEHPFGAGKIAKETLWYISEKGRGGNAIKMLKEYENWAIKNNCKTIGMASLCSNDVSRLYERLGYKAMEVHFTKEL